MQFEDNSYLYKFLSMTVLDTNRFDYLVNNYDDTKSLAVGVILQETLVLMAFVFPIKHYFSHWLPVATFFVGPQKFLLIPPN